MLCQDAPACEAENGYAKQLATLWTERPRSYVIARYQIMFEAMGNPTLQKIIADRGVAIQEIWDEIFRRLGSRDLSKSAHPWVDIARGLLLDPNHDFKSRQVAGSAGIASS